MHALRIFLSFPDDFAEEHGIARDVIEQLAGSHLVRGKVASVFSYAKHVSLEFGAGASLPDTFKVLEGEGKFRRHIKLSSMQDIAGKHVREYLLLALDAALEP